VRQTLATSELFLPEEISFTKKVKKLFFSPGNKCFFWQHLCVIPVKNVARKNTTSKPKNFKTTHEMQNLVFAHGVWQNIMLHYKLLWHTGR
jgi:hypothetical protein